MITPRQTRLIRVAGLHGLQCAISETTSCLDLPALRDCAVIVPSGAAANQLRRTLERRSLQLEAPSAVDRALCLPDVVTRSAWYDVLHARLAFPPYRLTTFEREVLLGAAGRAAAAGGAPPPFGLRPGLLVEMLGLYDDLRRLNQTVDRFERLVTDELERDVASDRGAERLLVQTRFLAAAFRRYEARLESTGGVDEHALRARLLQFGLTRPLRHVVVTVGDHVGDANGLWPADFDLLARLPSLERVDIIATTAALSAGLHERLHELLPGIEEWPLAGHDEPPPRPPALLVPAGDDGSLFFASRDREEELADIARRVKRLAHSSAEGSSGPDLDRAAVIFKRPLPYVYLAREVFGAAGIAHQTADALPLAAEPYAAALDLVFDFVVSGFTRRATTALLGSPHFTFTARGRRIDLSDVAALDGALRNAGYLGDCDRLRELGAHSWPMTAGARVAGEAAVAAADELQPLCSDEPPSRQLAVLLRFLRVHDRLPALGDPLRERHLRARAAIQAAIATQCRAHERFDDESRPFTELVGMLRRWIESQMFAPRADAAGVQFLDAQAARYGEFDEVCLVGLIDGEWPEPSAKSIFYPRAVLKRLGWPDLRARLAAERAAFRDLLALPARHVAISTFRLEEDTIVGPSVFLEDPDLAALPRAVAEPLGEERIFLAEALIAEPIMPTAVTGEAAEWLAVRLARPNPADPVFHGSVDPHEHETYSLTSLEQYLKCPFQFFAQRVLKLEEEPEDEPTLSPKARGVFVHAVFQAFFSEWANLGRQDITAENLNDARQLFRTVVDPLLRTLPVADAVVERARLLGSAADEGLAETVFRLEAERPTPVVERLLEYPLNGTFEIRNETGVVRRVSLRGTADRIDLLADGTFRLLDYKLGRAPDRAVALQLPIYSVCAEQQLRVDRGRDWRSGEAGYIAFGDPRRFVPMLAGGGDHAITLGEAQVKLLRAIDGITRGEFPARPADVVHCTRCPYSAVCRKDYVGEV